MRRIDRLITGAVCITYLCVGRSQSRNSERFASVSTNSTVLVPSYLACRSETRSSVDGRTLTRTSSLLRQRPSMPSRQTDEAPCMALLSASRMSFTRKTCPPSTFPLSTRETTHGWRVGLSGSCRLGSGLGDGAHVANSVVWVLPKMRAPAALRGRTTLASTRGWSPL
jgi:hypothetical protein